jgi:AhpD family alkylhydroperoxidase
MNRVNEPEVSLEAVIRASGILTIEIPSGGHDMSTEEILSSVKAKFGFVPNILAEMTKSPSAAKVYLKGQEIMAGATLTPKEQQVVSLVISKANKCDYCSSAHRTASKAKGVSPEDLEAIESGGTPTDERLSNVVLATRRIAEKRGWLDHDDVNELEGMGINREQLYEIVAIIGLKTMTNYINHISHVPIDPQFGGR